MGATELPGRSQFLLSLAGFVVVFGAVCWLVTAGIGIQGAPLTHAIRPPSRHREAHQLSIAGLTN
jgi:hypothetical protein